MDRRKFLKITGLSLTGLAVQPLGNLLSEPAFAKNGESVGKPVKPKWAMVVNPYGCSKEPGCRDCIDACHRVHNVPDFGNHKDEIKWIWTAPYGEVFSDQGHAPAKESLLKTSPMVLCNHCENPPCVKVCPTKATWKREDGIVMMDYHRCIGCRYCMAACPYGARSFNWKDPRPFIKNINQDYPTRTKGVVEKCNFCEERLAKGLIPACVEACKDRALTFGDLAASGSKVKALLSERYSIRRKPFLGTEPKVYYVL
jgi:Fe-S-cluster-containing dehydrogenase component